MARTALIVKTRRKQEKAARAAKAGKKVKFSTRVYNRCKLCGRQGGYVRKFEMCRICVRQKALNGELMGVKKSSW